MAGLWISIEAHRRFRQSSLVIKMLLKRKRKTMRLKKSHPKRRQLTIHLSLSSRLRPQIMKTTFSASQMLPDWRKIKMAPHPVWIVENWVNRRKWSWKATYQMETQIIMTSREESWKEQSKTRTIKKEKSGERLNSLNTRITLLTSMNKPMKIDWHQCVDLKNLEEGKVSPLGCRCDALTHSSPASV